jgi:hypothetical protein
MTPTSEEPFIDTNDLTGGELFTEELEAEIADATLLAIHTDAYSSRPFCRWEVLRAKLGPWIRGAPHSGFSTLIRRIKARSAALICGRPPNGRDFRRQHRRKPARCQRTSVSG